MHQEANDTVTMEAQCKQLQKTHQETEQNQMKKLALLICRGICNFKKNTLQDIETTKSKNSLKKTRQPNKERVSQIEQNGNE